MIGNIIKSERNKQNMKQNILAKGICSPSYLCKIENNQVNASEEVLTMLIDRLNITINVNEKPTDSDVDGRREILQIYNEAIKKRTGSYAKEKYDYLVQNQKTFLSKKSYYEYNLVLLYLLIAIEISSKEIDRSISILIKQEENLNNFQTYLLKKCLAIYHYYRSEHSKSSAFFDEAHLIFPEAYLDHYEKADLAYMNSLAKLANNQYFTVIEIVGKATAYFQESVLFSRLIECLLVEGIAFQRLQNLNQANEIYNKALKIAENSNNENLKAVIYQNLGSVHAALGNLDRSLEYYMNSLGLKENSRDQVISILSIVQIYSRKKDYNLLEEWLDKGILLVGKEESLKSYFYHFKLYQQFFLELNNLKFIEQAINYFDDNQDYRHVYKYAIKIAEILKDKGKYKLASDYYQQAIHVKNIQLLNWEDL